MLTSVLLRSALAFDQTELINRSIDQYAKDLPRNHTIFYIKATPGNTYFLSGNRIE